MKNVARHDTFGGVVGHVDITPKDCDLCGLEAHPDGKYDFIRDKGTWVGKVWAHECCHAQEAEALVQKAHWDHFTPEQQAKIEANCPPWLIGPAIEAFRFSRWFEIKAWVGQRFERMVRGR